jgi:16S rRNA (guanine1207-N2)-methyltransferase
LAIAALRAVSGFDQEGTMIRTELGGLELTFETAPSLFSPTAIDEGTVAMLRHAAITPEDKVLDLGCGYGVVGVYAARQTDPSRVWLVDADPLAVEFAQRNLRLNCVEGATVVRSDGFDALTETGFTKILCNRRITSISRFPSG